MLTESQIDYCKRQMARKRKARLLAKLSQVSLNRLRAAQAAAQRLRIQQVKENQESLDRIRAALDVAAHQRRVRRETPEHARARLHADAIARRDILTRAQARRKADGKSLRLHIQGETPGQPRARQDAHCDPNRIAEEHRNQMTSDNMITAIVQFCDSRMTAAERASVTSNCNFSSRQPLVTHHAPQITQVISHETATMKIKQEPPSPEPTEDVTFIDGVRSSWPNTKLSRFATQFPCMQDNEEPSSPGKYILPGDLDPYVLRRNTVDTFAKALTFMQDANNSSEQPELLVPSEFLSVQIEEESDENMVEAILPDKCPTSPLPEVTFEMTTTIKEEVDWDITNAAEQGNRNHNVLMKIKEEPKDWESSDSKTVVQSPSVEHPETNHLENAVCLVPTSAPRILLILASKQI